MWRGVLCVALWGLAVAGCSSPDRERLKDTTKPTYDEKTGKLKELTYDSNKNGKIDTWTEMDGTRPLRARIDRNEDGKLDRWEYYGGKGELVKVGFSRGDEGKPDAWAFPAADGKVARVEVSSTGDEAKIDRWERYDPSTATAEGLGALLAAEEDTNKDGRPDKWETYERGVLKTVEFDNDHDGRRELRWTYENGTLALIESAPDSAGAYTKQVRPK